MIHGRSWMYMEVWRRGSAGREEKERILGGEAGSMLHTQTAKWNPANTAERAQDAVHTCMQLSVNPLLLQMYADSKIKEKWMVKLRPISTVSKAHSMPALFIYTRASSAYAQIVVWKSVTPPSLLTPFCTWLPGCHALTVLFSPTYGLFHSISSSL
jgi:hypothetical protein